VSANLFGGTKADGLCEIGKVSDRAAIIEYKGSLVQAFLALGAGIGKGLDDMYRREGQGAHRAGRESRLSAQGI
jgi:hypothetical protein